MANEAGRAHAANLLVRRRALVARSVPEPNCSLERRHRGGRPLKSLGRGYRRRWESCSAVALPRTMRPCRVGLLGIAAWSGW